MPTLRGDRNGDDLVCDEFELPCLKLSQADLATIFAVLDASTDSFVQLAIIAGLDPAKDFIGANLRGVDFGTDDLTDFNFTDADLTGTDTSRARGIKLVVAAA